MVTTKKPTAALVVKKAPTKRAAAAAPVLKVTETKEQVHQAVVKKVAKKSSEILKQADYVHVSKHNDGVKKTLTKPLLHQLKDVKAGDVLKADKGTVKVTKVVAAEKPLTVAERFARRKPAIKNQKSPPRINITTRVKEIDDKINNLLIVPYVSPKCFGLPSKETILGISKAYEDLVNHYSVSEQTIVDNHEVVLQAIHATRTYNPGQVYMVSTEEEVLVFLMTYLITRLTAFQSAINSRMHVAYLKHIGDLSKPKTARK